MSRRFFTATLLLAMVPASTALAVTVTDNFDTSFNYLPGAVPAGSIWTRTLNPGAGGGLNQTPPVDPVPKFDANTSTPGSLTMSTFGVGFGGGGNTNAPALVREVSADQLREVRVHVSSQTNGQWSMGGILIRAPGPIDTVGANDNFFTFAGFREGGTGLGGTGFSATTQNVVNGAEAEMNTTGVVAAELEYLRVVHLGTGDFETYSSTDGVTWVQRQTFLNTGLATGTLEVGLWGGTFAGSNIMGGASAAFDYIQIDEAPDAPEALVNWAAAGSGDWNRSNWDVVGGKPDSNISVAVLGAGAPLTANATVYTNQNNTVKQLQFDNATFGYTVAGPGTLTLDSNAGNALIDVLSGTHEIQVDLLLNDNVTATAAPGTTLNINSRIFLNGRTFTTAGGGTINLNNGTVVAGSAAGAAGAVANEGRIAGLGGVDGDFSQSSSGILGFEVGSEPIQVTGDAVLGGVLDVSLADGFTPLAGHSYPVLTADTVTNMGLTLGGESADLFRLSVSGSAVSLVAAAVPEASTMGLVGIGLSVGALRRKRRRRCAPSNRRNVDLKKMSQRGTLVAFLFALWAATAHAQFGTFRDDFGNDATPHAQQHNYQPGTVPAGGIWTGVHNSMNGGGPFGVPPTFVAADFVADGFNFAGADKAGKLLIEDLVLHPNTDAQLGVGWEGGINNAPFLYREVPADAKITATMKIDAQNSGQWHYAPIIARLKAPTGQPDTPVGRGRGDTLDPTESFVTVGSFRTAMDNNVVSILTQSIVNAAETEVNTGGAVDDGLPLWIRLVKTGGLFESYTSLNGTDYTLRNSITNAELNTPGELLQVGPSNMSYSSGGGATQSTVEIDFFEITVEPAPIPRTAYWRPLASLAGSGNWDNANNWNSIEVPGIIPNHDTLKVIFANGDSAPPTGDVRVKGPATVFLNSAVKVKGLEFNHTQKYAIGGSGSILMAGNVGDADPTPTIDVLAGSHEVEVDFALDRNTNLTAAPGTRLDFNNQFDFAASNRALNVTGGGKVNFNSNINLTANGVVNVNSTGNVGGSGRINGTLNNNAGGTVSPGVGLGTLTVDAGYIQSGNAKLAIELGGTAPGTFDKISAAIVNLGASTATLEVSLVNGFAPLATDTFEIIKATGNLQSGTRFANTPGDVLTTPAGTFNVTYNYAAGFRNVTLSNFMPISMGIPGDFNHNGRVDAADYVVWRKSDGTPAGYSLWRTNFGRTSGSGSSIADAAAVPEPASIALLSVALLLGPGMARRRGS
jgi:hypothetical protein